MSGHIKWANRKWTIRAGGIVTLFCVSVIFFNAFFRGEAEGPKPDQPAPLASLINQPLPETRLLDLDGAELNNKGLRYGKVVLVLVTPDCQPCLEEGGFIQTVLNKRRDVRFFGVIPFGESKEVLKLAENKFPFKVFFDEGFLLGRALRVNKVPIKLYLEDGIIKKTWLGSTVYNHAEGEFNQWLESLP